jgi:hypothetical protein
MEKGKRKVFHGKIDGANFLEISAVSIPGLNQK